MKTSFYLIIISLILFNSCKTEITSPPIETPKDGGISLQIDKENIPTNVVMIEAFLLQEGHDTLYSELNILSSTSAEILFEDIPVGLWNLRVDAKNGEGVIVYTGEADVTILDGILTQVSLVLNPTGSGVGKVYIYVTWGNINVWYDYINNPVFSYLDLPTNPIAVAEAKVIKENDVYKMYYLNLYNGARTDIGYAESSNGILWNDVVDKPVLNVGNNTSWDRHSVQIGAVIKIENIYRMYYTGMNSPNSYWHVGLATSTDGINWTKLPNPVLYGGEDEPQIHVDCVVKYNNVYLTYYTIRNPYSIPFYSIGMAISEDGITWTKYGGNPILENSDLWENGGVFFPSVILDGNQFKMVYMNASADAFGMATSSDGINWTKLSSNPIFTKENTSNDWAEQDIAYPHLMKIGNEYRIYYSGIGNGADNYQIGFIRKFGD
jgi:predicted GH43/DUF377 family glycosyl hydrolase